MIRDYCLIYEPVTSSSKDTEETRLQIDGNNAVYDDMCTYQPMAIGSMLVL